MFFFLQQHIQQKNMPLFIYGPSTNHGYPNSVSGAVEPLGFIDGLWVEQKMS